MQLLRLPPHQPAWLSLGRSRLAMLPGDHGGRIVLADSDLPMQQPAKPPAPSQPHRGPALDLEAQVKTKQLPRTETMPPRRPRLVFGQNLGP